MSIHKIAFGITSRCNLECIACPGANHKGLLKMITVEDFEQCLNNIDVGVVDMFKLYNCCSESFMHPELVPILRCIRNKNWKVKSIHITTNAQIIHSGIEKIFEEKLVDRFAVSCDGDGTKASFEIMRKGALWEQLIKFLTIVAKLRDKHNSNIPLVTQTICNDKEAQEKWLSLLCPIGWTPEFRKLSRLPQKTEISNHIKVGNGCCYHVKSSRKRLYINCFGEVVPCCAYPHPYTFGSLKQQKFSEIYYGEKRKYFCRLLKKHRNEIPYCNDCSQK